MRRLWSLCFTRRLVSLPTDHHYGACTRGRGGGKVFFLPLSGFSRKVGLRLLLYVCVVATEPRLVPPHVHACARVRFPSQTCWLVCNILWSVVSTVLFDPAAAYLRLQASLLSSSSSPLSPYSSDTGGASSALISRPLSFGNRISAPMADASLQHSIPLSLAAVPPEPSTLLPGPNSPLASSSSSSEGQQQEEKAQHVMDRGEQRKKKETISVSSSSFHGAVSHESKHSLSPSASVSSSHSHMPSPAVSPRADYPAASPASSGPLEPSSLPSRPHSLPSSSSRASPPRLPPRRSVSSSTRASSSSPSPRQQLVKSTGRPSSYSSSVAPPPRAQQKSPSVGLASPARPSPRVVGAY